MKTSTDTTFTKMHNTNAIFEKISKLLQPASEHYFERQTILRTVGDCGSGEDDSSCFLRKAEAFAAFSTAMP